MKSVYIAGPYTAYDRVGEDGNIAAAASAAAEYFRNGWAVFCPHTMTAIIDRQFNGNKTITYEDWLATDIYWLSKCDAIHLLPGWRDSKGANIEFMVAKGLGLEILGEE